MQFRIHTLRYIILSLRRRVEFKLSHSDGMCIHTTLLTIKSGAISNYRIETSINASIYRFAMVYSVTDRSSFEEIEKLHRDILRLKECSYIPMFLVGNKCDSDLERVVSYTQGEVLAKSLGVKFIETSAKYGDNVDQLFFDLVRDIWKNQEIKSTDSEESLLFPEESEDSEPKRRKCCFL